MVAYKLGSGSIQIQFVGSRDIYLYDSQSPGPAAVAEMQRLAESGRGLATYISRHVRANYRTKL